MTTDLLKILERGLQDDGADAPVAVRIEEPLEPIGGIAQPVQPPTYAASGAGSQSKSLDRNYARYAVPRIGPDGAPILQPDGKVATQEDAALDSVQAQGNRFEEAVLRLIDDGRLDLPLTEVIVRAGSDGPALAGEHTVRNLRHSRRITNLTAPARQNDPLFRFGLIGVDDYAALDPEPLLDAALQHEQNGFVPFAWTLLGERLLAPSPDDLRDILRYYPLSLLLGFWNSFPTGISSERPRLARRYRSEIVAHDTSAVSAGTTKGSLFDEAKDAGAVVVDEGNPRGFRYDRHEGDAKRASKNEKGRPSNIGAGATPVAVHVDGVIARSIDWNTTISIRALTQTPLGSADRRVSAESRDDAALALTLLGLIGRQRASLSLRSGTELVRKEGAARTTSIVRADGVVEAVELPGVGELIDDFEQVRERLNSRGELRIGHRGDSSIRLYVSKGYADIIDVSNEPKSIVSGSESGSD